MKRLVALLLLVPPLASAQVPQSFQVTSGSTQFPFTPSSGGGFSIAGDGFTGRAEFTFVEMLNPLSSPFIPVGGFLDVVIQDTSPDVGMSVTLNGVPWSNDPESDGAGLITASLGANVPARPGKFSVPFEFNANFFGAPASEFPPIDNGCGDPRVSCQMLVFGSSGTAVFDVAPFQGLPGQFHINQATFTFTAPEPSTFWLLVLGFAGLATARDRRVFGI